MSATTQQLDGERLPVPEADRELVERARRYEPEALAEAFDRNFDGIYSFVFAVSGDHEQAEELATQVFTRALDSLRQYRAPGPGMTAFLYRVAQSLLVPHLRAQARQARAEAAAGAAGEEPGPARDRLAVIRESLGELPESQLKVIMLRFLAGMDSEEIAHVNGTSIGHVQALQRRGLKRLRLVLHRRGIER